MKQIAFLLFLLAANRAFGQSIYFYDSLGVEVAGRKLAYPWSGGMNSPQPAHVDLDADGIKEWVFFERTSGKFVVVGKPELEARLPLARGWALWADINADGKPDLMVDTPEGSIAAYTLERGTLSLQSAQLQSTLFSGNPTDLTVDVTDYPAVWDVDGDGDLDFFNFVPAVGTTMEFHRNLWKQTGKWVFEKETNFWGEFVECANCGDFFFGQAAGCRREATMHAGSATTLLQWNSSTTPAMLISDVGCSEVYLMQGIRNQKNEVVFKEFDFFPADTAVDMVSMPCGFVVGDSLLFSPTLLTNEGNLSDFTRSLWLYEKGENSQYKLKSRNFLQRDMIDLGELAQAAFVDGDGDGDLDLVAVSRGKFYEGKFRSTLHFFENEGFFYRLKDENWLNLADSGFVEMRIDASGKNLIMSARISGTNRSGFYQISNFEKVEKVAIPYDVLDEPNWVDIDGDLDLDILVAKFNGSLQLFENQDGKYILSNNAVCGFRPDFRRLNLSIAVVGNDLLILSNSGQLQFVRNFKDSLQASTTPQTLLEHHFGRNNSLAVKDNLIFVGTAAGGFNCLKFTELKPTAPKQVAPVLYPNPAQDFFKIGASGVFMVEVFDALGRKMLEQQATAQTQIPVFQWPQGMYWVAVRRHDGGKTVLKLLVR